MYFELVVKHNKVILIIQDIFDIEHVNYFSSATFPTLCCVIHATSNDCVEKEDIICVLDFKVEPTYYESHMLHSSYLSINLGVFDNASITILHTSSHALVTTNLETHISNHQKELLSSKTSNNFILDLSGNNRITEENNDSKLTHFSSKN